MATVAEFGAPEQIHVPPYIKRSSDAHLAGGITIHHRVAHLVTQLQTTNPAT
jgi:hypothetical protein